MSLLTSKDLNWFSLANAGHPPGFYPFKDRFLKRFAMFDGYCLQEIERECWTCEGSGEYVKGEPCRKCGGDGIWRTDTNWLECWNLSDKVYHRPIDPLPHWQRESAPMRESISGRIKHAPVRDVVARRAFYLLLRHEPVNFFHQVSDDIRRQLSNWRARHYWKLMRLRDKLDLFPAVNKDDTVPF